MARASDAAKNVQGQPGTDLGMKKALPVDTLPKARVNWWSSWFPSCRGKAGAGVEGNTGKQRSPGCVCVTRAGPLTCVTPSLLMGRWSWVFGGSGWAPWGDNSAVRGDSAVTGVLQLVTGTGQWYPPVRAVLKGKKGGFRNTNRNNRNERSRGCSLLHGEDMGNTQNHRKSVEQWLAVGGGWRLAVGDPDPSGLSLTKKKLGVLKDSPASGKPCLPPRYPAGSEGHRGGGGGRGNCCRSTFSTPVRHVPKWGDRAGPTSRDVNGSFSFTSSQSSTCMNTPFFSTWPLNPSPSSHLWGR